jgi:predicted transcriptional regulator
MKSLRNSQPTADSATLTVRLGLAIRDRLEGLATTTKRSKSALAAEAIEEFVALKEWQIEGIKKAISSLDRGEGVPHEHVEAWVSSRDTDDPHPMPKTV